MTDLAATNPSPDLPARLVVGTYSVEPRGDDATAGTGLRVLELDSRSGGEPSYGTVGHEALASPTWVVAHPRRPWLVSVGETDPSEVVCTELGDDGSLTVLGRCATSGDSGCHLALSEDGRWALVAHYASGTVETFALADDGSVTGPVGRWELTGETGPDPERQDRSHAHQVVLDPARPGEVLVCDLGTDRVHRLRLQEDGDLAQAAEPLRLRPGSGPRHLVVDGDVLLVACELACELQVFLREGTGWRPTAAVPTARQDREEQDAPRSRPVAASELQVVDDLVLVATRGLDVLRVLSLDRSAGTVEPVAQVSCQGQHPRDLVVADGVVWVANQWSDEVVALALDAVAAGREDPPLCRVALPRPARVLLLDRRSAHRRTSRQGR